MLSKILNKHTLLDLLFYLGFSLVIWNTCRPLLGDYLAMLFSTLPGIIYTVYTFIKEKQYSVTGLFILATMIVSCILNLDSRTAHQMLWNYVYMNIGLVIFWCLTILAKRPMAMYFFIDYAYLHGVPKEHTRVVYRQMPYIRYFIFLTSFLAIRDFSNILIRIHLIRFYDVGGYNKISIITQGWSMITTIMFIYGIILIIKKIQIHKTELLQEKQQA
jgi:hypothetical protein